MDRYFDIFTTLHCNWSKNVERLTFDYEETMTNDSGETMTSDCGETMTSDYRERL